MAIWLLASACQRAPAPHPVAASVATPAPEYDPPTSELRFRRALLERGVPVDRMTPAAGVEAMLDFYAHTRFAVSPGGDRLRIEWHVDRDTRRVRFTVARDFVWPSPDAAGGVERWSMWMTFQPPGSDLAPDASEGRYWCAGANARETCAAFLQSLPFYRRIASRVDDTVEIGFDPTPR